jgi:hypothetical protein
VDQLVDEHRRHRQVVEDQQPEQTDRQAAHGARPVVDPAGIADHDRDEEDRLSRGKEPIRSERQPLGEQEREDDEKQDGAGQLATVAPPERPAHR